jgi:hypothetical protein
LGPARRARHAGLRHGHVCGPELHLPRPSAWLDWNSGTLPSRPPERPPGPSDPPPSPPRSRWTASRTRGRERAAAGDLVGARRHYDDDEGDRAVVYFGEPIRSGYMLIQRDHLANLTSLEPARWTRAHPSSAARWASGSWPSLSARRAEQRQSRPCEPFARRGPGRLAGGFCARERPPRRRLWHCAGNRRRRAFVDAAGRAVVGRAPNASEQKGATDERSGSIGTRIPPDGSRPPARGSLQCRPGLRGQPLHGEVPVRARPR